MKPATPFCLLCGLRCDDPQTFRVTDASEVQQLLAAACVPTAFHYASVVSLPGKARHPLCIPCVNWKRRAKKMSRLPRWKRLTPLDSILMHTVAPAHYPEPDQRCFERLARAAADPDNGFCAVIPERIRQILAGAVSSKDTRPCAVSAEILRGWWRANHETAFFRHPETARAIRHTLISADPAQDGTRRRWRR